VHAVGQRGDSEEAGVFAGAFAVGDARRVEFVTDGSREAEEAVGIDREAITDESGCGIA
jgi:hypothetical protein